MKGRKPKPTELKLLNGNPGKRPLSEPLTYEDGDINAPEELLHAKNKIALQEWDRQVPLLLKAKIYKKVDRASMILYCLAFQHYIQTSENIRDYGYFIKTINGQLAINPAVKLQKNYFEQVTKMVSEFGMTPTSRVRLEGFGIDAPEESDMIKNIFG